MQAETRHSMNMTDVAVVGAGPYGLSLAAHLAKAGVKHRIFGRAMDSWREHMPHGMCLKSDGFASDLYDPAGAFTLERYCREAGIPYQRSGLPIPLETFVAYGLEFQKRMVAHLEEVRVSNITRDPSGNYLLVTSEGETLLAKRVVLAIGITHFAYTPDVLTSLPREVMSHSSEYGDVSKFQGKTIAVVGAGASAIDFASALADIGATVHIIGRREKLGFYTPDLEPRPFKDRVRKPRSGLGLGWKLRFLADAPLAFYRLPRNLGPVPGWFMRDKIENRIPLHMGAHIQKAELHHNRARLRYSQVDKPEQEFVADHVIAATGYRPSMHSLRFIDQAITGRVRTIEGSPVLNRAFETTEPGLHVIGLASANSFGPVCRFALGAKFTARHLSRYLKSQLQ